MIRVLVVDQDTVLLEEIVHALRDQFDVDAVTNKGDCLDLLRQNEFEVIVACERLADGSGLELLGQIAKRWPATLRVFAADLERLRLLQGRLGPFELFQTLTYPIDPDKLLQILSLATAAQDADADTTNIQHVVMGGDNEAHDRAPSSPAPAEEPPAARRAPVAALRPEPAAVARPARDGKARPGPDTPSRQAAPQRRTAASRRARAPAPPAIRPVRAVAARRKPVDLHAVHTLPASPAALPPAAFKLEPAVDEPTKKTALLIGAVGMVVVAIALSFKFLGSGSAPPPPQVALETAPPAAEDARSPGATSPVTAAPSKPAATSMPGASKSAGPSKLDGGVSSRRDTATASRAHSAASSTVQSAASDLARVPPPSSLRQSAPIEPPLVGPAAAGDLTSPPAAATAAAKPESGTSFAGHTLEQSDAPPTPDPRSNEHSDAPRRGLAPPPGTREAQLVHRVPPDYPANAARQRIEGFVDLQFLITAEGLVSNITIANASPPDIFDRAAIAAVAAWRYSPRVVEGQPVASPEQVRLQFKLDP